MRDVFRTPTDVSSAGRGRPGRFTAAGIYSIMRSGMPPGGVNPLHASSPHRDELCIARPSRVKGAGPRPAR